MSVIAKNKKAYFDYQIIEKLEAGLVLLGPEVKSARENRVDIKHSFIKLESGEVFLVNAHIKPYPNTHYFELDPERKRKLLLTKKQIESIRKKCEEKGFTLVPLTMFFRGSWVKLEIAIVKGKSKYDKRDSIKERDVKRDIERERKRYY